jgi:hypothetical protein
MAPDKQERPATAADIEVVLAELGKLRAEMAALSDRFPPTPSKLEELPAGRSDSLLPEQLVTLDQIGAIVHRSKRSMERYLSQMPAPHVRGRRGQPHLWSWTEVRPWLETAFGFSLPECFPGSAH